jgi:glycosyltransferase involved in cell wall biosynthesis
LGEAIESVLANDVPSIVCIVDDASTDETPEIAAEFARRHSRIQYLRNETRRGQAGSLNRAIASLEAEFVVNLDADDRIGPHYLSDAGRILAGGADVVNPDAILFGDRDERWIVPETTSLLMLLERNSVHCASAYRRRLWLEVGGIDEQIPFWVDYEFWIRLAAAGAQIQGLHGDHFFYRVHEGAMTHSANRVKHELRHYLRRKHAALYAIANHMRQRR